MSEIAYAQVHFDPCEFKEYLRLDGLLEEQRYKSEKGQRVWEWLITDKKGGREEGNPVFCEISVSPLRYGTTIEHLNSYFGRYGNIVTSVILLNPNKERRDGIGYVLFSSLSEVDAVLGARPHVLKGLHLKTRRVIERQFSKKRNLGREIDMLNRRMKAVCIRLDIVLTPTKGEKEKRDMEYEIDILKERMNVLCDLLAI